MKVKVIVSAVVLAVSGCGQTSPAGTNPPPNMSNDAIINAVLAYRACPSQPDTLQSIATKVLAQRNATLQGTGVFRRVGDQAHVAIAFEQQGSLAEATFTYKLSSGQVMPSNTTGEDIFKALSGECMAKTSTSLRVDLG